MKDPSEILQEARKALQAKKYPIALEKYEYFFDHALDDDPYAMYGVRLSYCLSEWASMGQEFPEAINRLEVKRDEALDKFESDQIADSFHDYMALCRCLGTPDSPVERFLSYNMANENLALACAHYIWDDLAERKLWELAAKYLPNPEKKYEFLLGKLDETLQIAKDDPINGGKALVDQAKKWHVKDVSNILLALKSTNQRALYSEIKNRAFSDIEERDFQELKVEIENATAL